MVIVAADLPGWAQLVRAVRQQRRLSQTQLGAVLGRVDRHTISRWERGLVEMPAYLLPLLREWLVGQPLAVRLLVLAAELEAEVGAGLVTAEDAAEMRATLRRCLALLGVQD